MLWKVWRSIVSACMLKGLSLDESLDIDSLARTVEDDDIPIPVFHAVVNRVQADRGGIDVRLDATVCVQWTGAVLLQFRSEGAGPVAVIDFLRNWRDQLPEPWRENATLDALKGKYTQPSKDTIQFEQSEEIPDQTGSLLAQLKMTGPQSRKWHEKFRSARR
ncbi:MAG: hypothetical protein Q9181_000835 [Wetmoreana brouardii]